MDESGELITSKVTPAPRDKTPIFYLTLAPILLAMKILTNTLKYIETTCSVHMHMISGLTTWNWILSYVTYSL